MKSIRQEILIKINKCNELTVDELQDQLTEFSRRQLLDNCQQAFNEKLLTRRKDDVTGMPAYKVTDMGKSRIKSPDVVNPVPVDINQAQSVKEAVSARGAETIAKIAAVIDAGATENDRLHDALNKSESAREIHVKSLIAMESEKVELSRENSMLRDSQAEGVQRIDVLDAENAVMKDEIDTLVEECNRLKSTNLILNALCADQNKPLAHPVTQYLIRNKNTAPTIASSFESARTIAKKTAITHGGVVEVFAMVKAGRAHRGAEWVQA